MNQLVWQAVIVVLLAGSPLGATAGSVWRTEVTDYQEPVVTVGSDWWNQVRSWLASRVHVERPAVGTSFTVTSSAYASSPYQTDNTPCITAAGTRVRPGVVATNFLPLGTIIAINGEPHIVEDRMNARYAGRYIDIWFPSTSEALAHGRKKLEITIIDYGAPGQKLKPDTISEDISPVVDPPGMIEKAGLRFVAWSRSLGKYVGAKADPNRFDVNCFSDSK